MACREARALFLKGTRADALNRLHTLLMMVGVGNLSEVFIIFLVGSTAYNLKGIHAVLGKVEPSGVQDYAIVFALNPEVPGSGESSQG